MFTRVYNSNDCRAFGFDETMSYNSHDSMFSSSSNGAYNISLCWSAAIYTNNIYPNNDFTGREGKRKRKSR